MTRGDSTSVWAGEEMGRLRVQRLLLVGHAGPRVPLVGDLAPVPLGCPPA